MNAVPAPRKPQSRPSGPAPSPTMSEAERKKALKNALQVCNLKYARMLRRLSK